MLNLPNETKIILKYSSETLWLILQEWEADMDQLKKELSKVKGEFDENLVRVQEFDVSIKCFSKQC